MPTGDAIPDGSPPVNDTTHLARQWDSGKWTDRHDAITIEAPLQICVNGERFATTMRTPGADHALARGLLFTESIVPDVQAAATITFTESPDPESGYTGSIDAITPSDSVAVSVGELRSSLMSAACGVCGTRDASRIEIYGPPLPRPKPGAINPISIHQLYERMADRQRDFSATGGSHAAAAFDAASECIACHEDVGRHNAADKVIGDMIAADRIEDARVMTLSGRASYEMVYKAYRAGIACLCSISAPSSMAVACADRFGITLIGFARGGRFTVYTHGDRVE